MEEISELSKDSRIYKPGEHVMYLQTAAGDVKIAVQITSETKTLEEAKEGVENCLQTVLAAWNHYIAEVANRGAIVIAEQMPVSKDQIPLPTRKPADGDSYPLSRI